ncbi:MAG: site-specific integrase [bacterium]|nr:site-specific integrase [bacterium]
MILKSAFKEFIQRDLIVKNPCEVTLPKQRKREYRVLTHAEYQSLIRVSPLYWKTLIMFDLETGLRPEEFLALTWANVTDRTIKVRKALVRFPKGEYQFTDPKNDSSRRTIPISATLQEQLKRHRHEQLKLRMETGPYWTDLDLVFPTEIGTPFTLSNLNRKFKALLEKADIPAMRPYDMRHTSATWLLEAGENIKVVSERLGHSGIAVTADTYLHVSEGMQESATSKLEKLIEVLPVVSKLCQDGEITQSETPSNTDENPVKQGITGLRKTA